MLTAAGPLNAAGLDHYLFTACILSMNLFYLFFREDMQTLVEYIPLWRRYIDDVFLIWTGSREELSCFFDGLKSNSYNLSFTMEANQSTLTFLDITIFVNPDRTIGTTLFRKPSAGNSLLHATSSHPHSIKRAYLKAKKQDRSHLIHGRTTPRLDPGLRLFTKFSGQHQQVRDLLQKHWYLLMGDPNVSKHLKDHPEITYRCSRSVRDHIVHSHYAPPSKDKTNIKGTRPCHKCDFCRYIYSSRNIALPNRQVYNPNFLATCQSIGPGLNDMLSFKPFL